jgi:hypothetical protein
MSGEPRKLEGTVSNPFFGEMLRFLSALALGAVLLAAAVLDAAPGNAPSPPPNNPQQGPRRPDAKMLQPGQPAPDFELPRLVIEKDKDGNAAGKVSQEKVRLSSLAASTGARPVCLIFSSYT